MNFYIVEYFYLVRMAILTLISSIGLYYSHSFYEDDIVYIQGRTIEEAKPKYINLPKEIAYPYNVNLLLHPDIGGESVRICEGIIDTLTVLDAGDNAVGILGANNFKSKWVKLFDKYDVDPIIALDSDKPGDDGAETLANIFKRDMKRESPVNSKDWNGSIKKN